MNTVSTSSVPFLIHTGRRIAVCEGARFDPNELIPKRLPVEAVNAGQAWRRRLEGDSSDRAKSREWTQLQKISIGG